MQELRALLTPGTVSKILWHFTGGPVWDPKQRRQGKTRKQPAQAYANLKSILKTRELRLGSFKEIIHVALSPLKVRDRHTGAIHLRDRDPVDVESSPVCCLADIPAPHLGYHCCRYGKFAIGFHRDAVNKAGFNPVLYTLHDAATLRSIYRGFAALNRLNVEAIRKAAKNIDDALDDLQDDEHDTSDAWRDLVDIQDEADWIDKRLATSRQSVSDFLAFVKTFERTEFNTIYCEREWRSTQNFTFDVEDIAMVVLPKEAGGEDYFHRFIEKSSVGKGLPRRVPIVAWEDLVES